jgi:hypothetical protein
MDFTDYTDFEEIDGERERNACVLWCVFICVICGKRKKRLPPNKRTN